jgi:hypothetical protein
LPATRTPVSNLTIWPVAYAKRDADGCAVEDVPNARPLAQVKALLASTRR